MNGKTTLFFPAIFLLFIFSFLVKLPGYTPFQLPTKASQGTSGTYYIKSVDARFYAPRGVSGVLYIPKFKKGMAASSRPLIVFYHGATRNANAYKNIAFMKKLADKYGFTLLSMQNVWGMDTRNRDTSRAILDSAEGTMEIVTELIKQKTVRTDAIYAAGSSAGGFTALCVAIIRPDQYRGVGNFKGNYYQDVFDVMLKENKGWRDYYKIPDTRPNIKDLSYYFALGGAKEAKRVKEQMPQARAFMEGKLNARINFHSYPNEGHGFTIKNFQDFWSMVEKNL